MNSSTVHTADVSLQPDNNGVQARYTIHYLIADPTGNITILVLDPVPVCDQSAVAAVLMKKESAAEQVGFLTLPEPARTDFSDPIISPHPGFKKYDLKLRMAGGEFCGNASMSAAAFRAWQTGLQHAQFTLHVSGTDVPVVVKIDAAEKPMSWFGQVQMPDPRKIEVVSFPEDIQLPVVAFDGITHIIIQDGQDFIKNGLNPSVRSRAEDHARKWCRFLQAEALGILFLNASADRLIPLVYVPGADTLFWETSCGSGSAAAGAWLASHENRKITVSLKQPGGTLEVIASPGGPLFLKGTVTFI